jgi:BMFP domain-containing protein YqiC
VFTYPLHCAKKHSSSSKEASINQPLDILLEPIMQKDHPFFEDLSKLASGAAGAVMDMRREVEGMVAAQCQALLERMNLVRRDEFDVVKLMAQSHAAELEALKNRLEALEKEQHSHS